MAAKVTGLIPLAPAADLQRSVDFYKLLGMEIRGSLRNASGGLQWVHLSCDQADLMLSRASEPVVAGKQAVLFYLYSPDLIALREHLMANGVKASAITYPEPKSQKNMCGFGPLLRKDSRRRSFSSAGPMPVAKIRARRNLHCIDGYRSAEAGLERNRGTSTLLMTSWQRSWLPRVGLNAGRLMTPERRSSEYFAKGRKMVTVDRSYSMGAGNGIGLAITISDPLPQNPPKVPSNPAVVVADDWNTYASPDVGLKLRYPPKWTMRDDSPKDGGTSYKYLSFGAERYTPGEFRLSVGPDQTANLGETGDAEGAGCFPSGYRISGFSAQECVFEDEVVSEGVCERHIHSFVIQTGKYDLTFEPSGGGSFADDSGHYTLLDIYEKIMSTIEIKHSN
jgi:hypothetical protein